MKKIISLILVISVLLALPCAACADPGSEVTVASSAQLAGFIFHEAGDPAKITKASLDRGNGPEDIYVIGLLGTAYTLTSSNNVFEYLLSTVSIGSTYFAKIRDAAKQYIPKGSKLLFAGHSLGGMTAQLLAADKTMRERYDIIGTVAFGSPITVTANREGFLRRLADRSDLVPLFSLAGPFNLFDKVSFESGKYGILFISAHTESYLNKDTWRGYDCLGVRGGNAVIRYDPADVIPVTAKLFR